MPKGVDGEGFFKSERRGRVKTPDCRRCVYDRRCLGFEQGYVDRYGTSAVRPISEVLK